MSAAPSERGAGSVGGASSSDRQFIGWDVGGANTKVATVAGGVVRVAHVRWYELQRAPHELPALLGELASRAGAQPGDAHALTMTAELSQFFRMKRDGVAFVLDAVERAFPGEAVRVYTV